MSSLVDHAVAAATLPAFVTEAPKRTRKTHKRGSTLGEAVARELPDGSLSVSLFGSRAAGRSMTVDADVWAEIAGRFTARWVVNDDGNGNEYIRSGVRHIGDVALQPGERPTATLARIILGARRGEKVIYTNDDHLDLRLSNLSLEYPRRSSQTTRHE
jgi:hypothetical protein